MKVYVVTINEVSGFEQFDHDPYVFAKKEDARALLSEARDEAIEEYMEDGDEDCPCAIDKDTEDYFALYDQDNGWSHTHYEVSVCECEIRCLGTDSRMLNQ